MRGQIDVNRRVGRRSRFALFIDGPNLYATAKTLGLEIDYKRLLSEFRSYGTLLRAFYYTPIIEDQEHSSIRPLVDWLDYNGFTVVTKRVKEFVDALVKAGQRVEYVQVGGANHAFFDWKPDAATQATFAKYGVYYAAGMKEFFLSSLY